MSTGCMNIVCFINISSSNIYEHNDIYIFLLNNNINEVIRPVLNS